MLTKQQRKGLHIVVRVFFRCTLYVCRMHDDKYADAPGTPADPLCKKHKKRPAEDDASFVFGRGPLWRDMIEHTLRPLPACHHLLFQRREQRACTPALLPLCFHLSGSTQEKPLPRLLQPAVDSATAPAAVSSNNPRAEPWPRCRGLACSTTRR